MSSNISILYETAVVEQRNAVIGVDPPLDSQEIKAGTRFQDRFLVAVEVANLNGTAGIAVGGKDVGIRTAVPHVVQFCIHHELEAKMLLVKRIDHSRILAIGIRNGMDHLRMLSVSKRRTQNESGTDIEESLAAAVLLRRHQTKRLTVGTDRGSRSGTDVAMIGAEKVFPICHHGVFDQQIVYCLIDSALRRSHIRCRDFGKHIKVIID